VRNILFLGFGGFYLNIFLRHKGPDLVRGEYRRLFRVGLTRRDIGLWLGGWIGARRLAIAGGENGDGRFRHILHRQRWGRGIVILGGTGGITTLGLALKGAEE
jgi:hypothetical protein